MSRFRGAAAGLLALLIAATVAASAAPLPGGAAAGRAQGRDAGHVLFGSHGAGRRLLGDGIDYETLRVVEHPLRADMSQKKVQQRHAGLELFGHTFVVGLAADGVTEQAEGTYGTIFTDLDKALPDTTPTLSTSAATDLAQATFQGATVTSTRLVIWVDKERDSAAHVAYLVTLVGSSAGAPAYVLVDAKNAHVLRAWREQRTQHAPRPRQQDSSTPTAQTQTLHPTPAQTLPQATATSAHADHAHIRRGLQQFQFVQVLQSKRKFINIWAIGGNKRIGRIYYNGTNRHPELQVTMIGDKCFFASQYVKTGDIRQVFTQEQWAGGAIMVFVEEGDVAWTSGNFSQLQEYYEKVPAVNYTCPKRGKYLATTDETKGAYSQQADTQAIMSVIFNMWKSWMGVDVLALFKAAGVPTPLLVIPHADPTFDNAFWSNWFFACGDGNQTLFYPLCTAGDVLSHELGHGVTQIINNGLLYFGQSGAWNEGFSDMLGMTYNFYDSGLVNPLLGADIMFNASVVALRNMSDPAQFRQSASALNVTSADPHILSGVPNLAFYRLATSRCYDPKVAMQVAQRAAHLYFSPTTSFEEGANAWARAAKDLGYAAPAVHEAWESVGLWQACGRREVVTASNYFRNPKVNASHYPRGDIHVVLYSAAANETVYVGNLTYHKINYGGLRPCGLTFKVLTLSAVFDDSEVAAVQNTRPSFYVGVNRMPDPFTGGGWDCKMDMEVSTPGPTQPGCDLPVTHNTTYYVVAHSLTSAWAVQAFGWQAWGPTVGINAVDEAPAAAAAAAAPKCFNGGTCTGASGCASGHCTLGYCTRKPRPAAAKRAHKH